MATNYTEHYGLSLWEANDKFYHQEFNENHRKIDAALASKADAAPTAEITTTLRADVDQLMSTQAAIVTGTYIGSGQYGAAHPNTLNFTGVLDRPPKLVIVRRQAEINKGLLLIRSMSTASYFIDGNDFADYKSFLTWDGFALSWYSNYHAESQMNMSGIVYCYIAIG